MIAAQSDPRVMRDQLDWSLTTLFHGELQAQPVVFVVEDAHWADLASLRLLDSVWSGLHDLALAIVVAARPSLSDRVPQLWKTHGAVELRLTELSRRAAEGRPARGHGARRGAA